LAIAGGEPASELASSTQPRPRTGVLSAREQEVVVLLASGLSNRQIGDQLVISGHTVQRHVENVLAKLGYNNRAQIAAWATAEGLISVDTGDVNPAPPT
jgi:DNA-binding NarL/FixJ family response regulator